MAKESKGDHTHLDKFIVCRTLVVDLADADRSTTDPARLMEDDTDANEEADSPMTDQEELSMLQPRPANGVLPMSQKAHQGSQRPARPTNDSPRNDSQTALQEDFQYTNDSRAHPKAKCIAEIDVRSSQLEPNHTISRRDAIEAYAASLRNIATARNSLRRPPTHTPPRQHIEAASTAATTATTYRDGSTDPSPQGRSASSSGDGSATYESITNGKKNSGVRPNHKSEDEEMADAHAE
ncbi:hypothetical protein QBC34DRAFT_423621 [Podospora aff. communis PSN243]|uniref:Uncharacterized protein n=1 Tax=Podospora aff. communis PSN243 TaxID=3040156 RepID=A0AAV9GYL3_9PEZI|nr:hypothetical protein QBC34DRAFT_423621 [Podospora aff. communis PSN243]